MIMTNKKGLSLLVLIISLIVILIIASAVILSLTKNDSIGLASKVQFETDLKSLQNELDMYKANERTSNPRTFNPSTLQADQTTVTCNGDVKDGENIYNILPSLKKAKEFDGKIAIVDGKLQFIGTDDNEKEWAKDVGVSVAIPDTTSPTVTFSTNGGSNLMSASTKVTVTDIGGSSLNLSSLQYAWDTQNVTTPINDWTSFTNGYMINKSNDGTYYLWIKAADNAGNSIEISSNSFTIDATAPSNPVLVASPTSWTNGNVTVNITYPGDAVVKQYSNDASSWNNYSLPIIITTNNTTLYAKCLDASGNQSGQASLTVANIDKILPTVTFGTNGANNVQPASTTVTLSDTGGSNINTSSLQYVWDTQNTATPSSGWTSFTNGASITKTDVGTYYLWIKGNDNAGNSIVSKSNAFTIIASQTYGTASVGTVATSDSTVDGKAPKYNNPIVPKGFKAVNSGASWPNGWNSGLIIEDSVGNQFMWIPVTTIPYTKWCITGLSYTQTTDDTLPAGVSSEQSQITKYGGFYVARFEAGKDSIGTLVSKQNMNVWTNVSYATAKSLAESMYTSAEVKSGLITGTQWDVIMQWLQNVGYNVATDSSAWGNYYALPPDVVYRVPINVLASMLIATTGGPTLQGSIRTTGYQSFYQANGIFDLAGNAWEWSSECVGSDRILRGGPYYDPGSIYPAAYREQTVVTQSSGTTGFRVVLYVQ